MKTCSKCKSEKPLEEFYVAARAKAGSHERQAYCKDCDRARRRKRVRDPESRYFENVKRLYGITREVYETYVVLQGGRCAACGDEPPANPPRRFFHVDHCHETGRVRGLLCLPCNVALGKLRDDPTRIMSLHDYITR